MGKYVLWGRGQGGYILSWSIDGEGGEDILTRWHYPGQVSSSMVRMACWKRAGTGQVLLDCTLLHIYNVYWRTICWRQKHQQRWYYNFQFLRTYGTTCMGWTSAMEGHSFVQSMCMYILLRSVLCHVSLHHWQNGKYRLGNIFFHFFFRKFSAWFTHIESVFHQRTIPCQMHPAI